MVRTKEVARMSTGDKYPPRKQLWQDAPCSMVASMELRQAASHAASSKARKIVTKASQKASVPKAPPMVAAKSVDEAVVAVQADVDVQAPEPVAGAPPKRPVRQAALKSLFKQKATKTLTKRKANDLSKQNATNPLKQKITKVSSKKFDTKTPSKQQASSSAEIDVSISVTCKHCKNRQRLDTEVVELCRREGKRKRIAKSKSHPEEVIDLSETDSDP